MYGNTTSLSWYNHLRNNGIFKIFSSNPLAPPTLALNICQYPRNLYTHFYLITQIQFEIKNKISHAIETPNHFYQFKTTIPFLLELKHSWPLKTESSSSSLYTSTHRSFPTSHHISGIYLCLVVLNFWCCRLAYLAPKKHVHLQVKNPGYIFYYFAYYNCFC